MYLNVYSSENEYRLIENVCGESTILEHIQKLDGVKLVNIINKINNFGNRCDGSIFYLADTQDTDEELLGAFNY